MGEWVLLQVWQLPEELKKNLPGLFNGIIIIFIITLLAM
jgi:hypothetical protein